MLDGGKDINGIMTQITNYKLDYMLTWEVQKAVRVHRRGVWEPKEVSPEEVTCQLRAKE